MVSPNYNLDTNTMSFSNLAGKKMAEIADNVICGPQANVLRELNQINESYDLDLNVTKTFRWGNGVYDKVKEKINDLQCFNMGNSGMYHLFRRMNENNVYYKRNLQSKLERLDSELARLRSERLVFQDNSDKTVEIFSKINEQVEETTKQINDDCEIDIRIIEPLDNEGNVDLLRYQIKLYFHFHNISVHMWSGSDKTYLGEIPVGSVSVNMQINLMTALNLLASTRRDMFKFTSLPSYIRNGSDIGTAAQLNNFRIYGLRHPYIGTNNMPYYMYKDSKDYPTEMHNWKNVCTGNMDSDIALKLFNFDIKEIHDEIKRWLSNYIVNQTHPLNEPNKWYHGLPEFLSKQENLYSIIGTKNLERCNNAIKIQDIEDDFVVGDPERKERIDTCLEYCKISNCQFQENCYTYNRYVETDAKFIREQLIIDISKLLYTDDEDVMEDIDFILKVKSNCSVFNVNDLLKKFEDEIKYANGLRLEILNKCVKYYEVIDNAVYADLNAFFSKSHDIKASFTDFINHFNNLETSFEDWDEEFSQEFWDEREQEQREYDDQQAYDEQIAEEIARDHLHVNNEVRLNDDDLEDFARQLREGNGFLVTHPNPNQPIQGDREQE